MTEQPNLNEVFDMMVSGVYIATADDGEIKAGCTVVWVSRCSFDPPMVAVFIAPERFSHDVVKRAKHFCLNVVGENHFELAKSFGLASSRDTDKYTGVSFEKAKTGAPVLNNACAYLDCEVVETYTTGDHTCFVGRVVAAERLSPEKPLKYRHSDYYPEEEQEAESKAESRN